MLFFLGFQSGVIFLSIILAIWYEIYSRKLKVKRRQYDELMTKGVEMQESAQYWHVMGMAKETQECLAEAQKLYNAAAELWKKNPKKKVSEEKKNGTK